MKRRDASLGLMLGIVRRLLFVLIAFAISRAGRRYNSPGRPSMPRR